MPDNLPKRHSLDYCNYSSGLEGCKQFSAIPPRNSKFLGDRAENTLMMRGFPGIPGHIGGVTSAFAALARRRAWVYCGINTFSTM